MADRDVVEVAARAWAVGFGVDPDGPSPTWSDPTRLAWQEFVPEARRLLAWRSAMKAVASMEPWE